jgi:hypothetical protein
LQALLDGFVGQTANPYAARFATEDRAFIRNQAYKSTQTIADKDRERDDLFLYIKSFIESHLYCPIAAKKTAAQELDFALTPYREAHKRPYDGETAQIASFITVQPTLLTSPRWDSPKPCKTSNGATKSLTPSTPDAPPTRKNAFRLTT